MKKDEYIKTTIDAIKLDGKSKLELAYSLISEVNQKYVALGLEDIQKQLQEILKEA